ncbi:hypothetical protein MMC29_001118 [Sticta canariensis]|nr:hypothetical protein [Sticta canariensis]
MSRSLRDLKGQRWGYDNQWISQEPYEKDIDQDDWHDELKMKISSGQHTNGHNTKPIRDLVQLCGTPVAELPAHYRPRGSDSPESSASNITCLESTSVVYDKSAISPLSQPSSPNNVSNIGSESVVLMPSMSSTFPTQRIVYNQSSSVVTPATAVGADAGSAVFVQGRGCNPRGIDHQKLFPPKGDISDFLRPFSCFGESTKDRILANTEASVEDLSGLVGVLHRGWMQRLTANIGESTMKAKVSQRSPFETGIRVLRQYWADGHLPKVFEDAFALMHIALACAWMYHRDDTLEFWNTFFKDVLKWHHVLLTPEDKVLFLTAAELIWSPPGSLSVEAIFYSGSLSLPHWSQPSSPFELDGDAPIQALCERESLPQELYTPSSQSFVGLTNSDFQNGVVIRVCARYLDGIEYLNIRNRNALQMSQSSWVPKPPSGKTQMIKIYMIDPLMQLDGLEDFRDQILETESFLNQGLLHNEREVELKLAFDGQLSHRSAPIYNTYRRAIASCCDDLMLQQNPIWRHRHYEADLQTVLDISYKNLPVNPRPRLNTARIITNPERPQHESPSSARSNYSSNSTNSVTATLTPSTFGGSSGSPSNDQPFIFTPELSPSTSPIELPAPDSSPLLAPPTGKRTSLRGDNVSPSSSPIKLPAPDSSSLLSSSTANNKSKRCRLCNTSFSGSRRDQTNNLRRHKRTIHYPRSEFPCPEPDCHKTFNRKDNLKKHWRDKHVDEIV